MNDTIDELRETTDGLRETVIWMESGNKPTKVQVKQLRSISNELDQHANALESGIQEE